MSLLLDSSAVLAAILGEPGGEIAFAAATEGAISIVNFCEVCTRLVQDGFSADAAQAQVRRFDLKLLPFTEQHALRAAALRPVTSHLGLSLGDRACLAHGLVDRKIIVTADRDWAKLDLGIDIRLIR